jgi:hypothetical protein
MLTRFARLAFLLALAAVLAACSSDSSSSATSSSSPSSSATATLSGAASSSAGPVNDEAAVRTLWTTFFGSSDPAVEGPLLEGGDKLQAVLTQAASQGSFPAKVSSVTFPSDTDCTTHDVPAPCALVTYDITDAAGNVQLPNVTGYATFINGTWLVSRTSYCDLVALGGQTCPSQ